MTALDNSGIPKNYLFIDSMPLNGINYYRLKQVDADANILTLPYAHLW
jgi:hypothetical protein